jgi:hypothetical protein
MARAKREPATELDTLIDRGQYLQQEAIQLAKQIEKIPFEERSINEPIRKANNLLSIAGRINDLARAILQKAALEEQRGEIERTLKARADEAET